LTLPAISKTYVYLKKNNTLRLKFVKESGGIAQAYTTFIFFGLPYTWGVEFPGPPYIHR
jgi:hypothetical protein